MATIDDDEVLRKIAAGDHSEPIFVLRGQDSLAPAVVDYWTVLAAQRGVPAAKREEASALRDRMRAWQREHPDRVKHPD